MRLFGKNKDTIRIKKVKSSRAVLVSLDVQEIEIKFITEDGEQLTVIMPPRLAAGFIQQTIIAYDAIYPRVRTGDFSSSWQGME